MPRIMLFTYHADEFFIKKIQVLLSETGSDILSVETAHCAAMNMKERIFDDLYLIEPKAKIGIENERIIEINKTKQFVAITADVSVFFEEQFSDSFFQLFQVKRLGEGTDGTCQLRLIPLNLFEKVLMPVKKTGS